MINILKNIFRYNRYNVQDAFDDINQSGFIGSIEHIDKRDYYFILDVDISNVRDNLIEDIIDEIIKKYWDINLLKEYGIGSDYKKNTSLLLLVKVNSVCDEYELSNKIYDIEESPYFFKRYVILYTEKQKELIKNIGIDKYLDILSDKEQFRNYKKNKKGECDFKVKINEKALVYDIISKFYIKIPFLVYNFNKNEELPILGQRINEALNNIQKEMIDILININSENGSYYKIFNAILKDPSSEEIEKKYNDILNEISYEDK